MGNDFIFIFLAILIITVLVYILYKIMLSTERGGGTEKELQITSEEILTQLTILNKEKKYHIVESLAKNYLSKKPHDTKVRTILAKALYAYGNTYDAIAQAKTVIKYKPDRSDMRIFLANCYMETNQVNDAINIFQEILDKDHENIVAIKELAKIYF
ncbi:MAG: tetratricopeptide repeat protein, partial [Candidatus Gastranaerophilales bacterium]|nr:tetratricopeptide repeat protein [Candidatus Gastranaerophilales bacterium]